MDIRRTTLETCAEAPGLVVVIDVLRAFTTAAFAFVAGAVDIALVSTVEEAFDLRKQVPGSLLMGEKNGLHIAGFDFGNSPAALLDVDLSGHHLIQRTSAGTQGVVRAVKANRLLTASLCCAGATVRYINEQAPTLVTFVETGIFREGWGDEDIACADYLESLLLGQPIDPASIIQRVVDSPTGRYFSDPAKPEFPAQDLECATDIDRFDFAMVVERTDGVLIMEAVKLNSGYLGMFRNGDLGSFWKK